MKIDSPRCNQEQLELNIKELYSGFNSALAEFDCGERCAPYNERGVPFCCDLKHTVPSAYREEWHYLKANTDLWRLWKAKNSLETEKLRAQTPQNQVLIACQGDENCQREFRSITCRAFPFFPYVTRQGEFIGLSYYWEYEDRCWVISHLDVVTRKYLSEFVATFQLIFEKIAGEVENFQYHSSVMRRIFGRKRRAITVLHRNGCAYKISPKNGRKRRIDINSLSKYGPYKIAYEMPFPGEFDFKNQP